MAYFDMYLCLCGMFWGHRGVAHKSFEPVKCVPLDRQVCAACLGHRGWHTSLGPVRRVPLDRQVCAACFGA